MCVRDSTAITCKKVYVLWRYYKYDILLKSLLYQYALNVCTVSQRASRSEPNECSQQEPGVGGDKCVKIMFQTVTVMGEYSHLFLVVLFFIHIYMKW